MTRADLITAVLSDPDAAWAVLTANVKVAGPWDGLTRTSSRGTVVSLVHKQGDAWFGEVFLSRAEEAKRCETKAEAESWCDQKLREAGWLLATGEVSTAVSSAYVAGFNAAKAEAVRICTEYGDRVYDDDDSRAWRAWECGKQIEAMTGEVEGG